jgi:hypothetical protein
MRTPEDMAKELIALATEASEEVERDAKTPALVVLAKVEQKAQDLKIVLAHLR